MMSACALDRKSSSAFANSSSSPSVREPISLPGSRWRASSIMPSDNCHDIVCRLLFVKKKTLVSRATEWRNTHIPDLGDNLEHNHVDYVSFLIYCAVGGE